MFQVEVLRESAAVRTLKLSDFFTTIADKQQFNKDPDAYMERINKPGADDGHYTLLNHVDHNKRRHLPMATSIYIKAPGEKWRKGPDIARRQWKMDPPTKDGDTHSISFHCIAKRGADRTEANNNPYLKVTKTYTVRKKDYTVDVSIKVENISKEKLTLKIDQRGPTGVPMESVRGDTRFAAWGVLEAENEIAAMVEEKTELTDEQIDARKVVGTTAGKPGETPEPAVAWIGQGNKFFASMLYLKPEVKERLNAANYNASIYFNAAYETIESKTHVTGIEIPELTLEPKSSKTVEFRLFAGPSKQPMFNDEDNELFRQEYLDLNYGSAINLKSCGFCTIDWLRLGMMWLLNTLAAIAFGNYGIAIFILVILVRLALHPLTKKGQVSMAKMQKMKPAMEKIKAKYANDKETLNKEMMKVYKEQGATPILGCLPMLLQMPIWIALYSGLNASVELRHAGLLPFWITDLAAPDALFQLGIDIPYIGSTFNLLPLLLTVAMFLQMKMNPAAAGATSPEMEAQQKMMKFMMPGMMLMFFYHAPSGLTLYIMTSVTAGVVEQIIIRKHIAEKEAQEAASTTKVSVSGRGFRDSREKKPKSPYKKPW